MSSWIKFEADEAYKKAIEERQEENEEQEYANVKKVIESIKEGVLIKSQVPAPSWSYFINE